MRSKHRRIRKKSRSTVTGARFTRWRACSGLSGVLRDEVAVNVEYVTTICQVYQGWGSRRRRVRDHHLSGVRRVPCVAVCCLAQRSRNPSRFPSADPCVAVHTPTAPMLVSSSDKVIIITTFTTMFQPRWWCALSARTRWNFNTILGGGVA